MERLWKYLENQFDSATADNYKKALILSMYHDAALFAAQTTEPLLAPIYDRYHPLHLAYVAEYNQWVSAGGAQEGQTLNLNQQLATGVTRLDTWDPQIQVVYNKTTPRYKAILPNGRKPFTRGSIDQRVNAFNSLSINIGADAALATVKTSVDSTYTALNNARIAQEGAKGVLKAESQDVEVARLAAMNMQYRNLAFVMDTLFDNLIEYANQLFDQQTLRDHQQSLFTGTLDPGETEAVLVHTFLGDDELRLKSNGAAAIKFYLASTPGGIDSNPVLINANEERVVSLNEFDPTDFATHRYLTAVNQSAAESTQYIVEVL